jgi:hypothetical protein
VGVHASTVSRTVHNKYIATPAGVFELQHFFSRGLQHTAGGASAPVAVQELIRELIAIEAPTAPLSDAALTRQLAQQGFHIARRSAGRSVLTFMGAHTMSIAFLAQLSRSRAPLTLTQPQEVHEPVMLRAAGLVVALTLRATESGHPREYGRFLALTPAGRVALAESQNQA